jgi:AraC-like DNA-binding protein
VRYVDSFAGELARLGAPVERLLNRVSLSEEMLAARDNLITVSQLWRFTSLAAKYTGETSIGLTAGLTPLEEHSQFGQNLLFAPTLLQAFDMFCRMAPTELTNAEFRLKRTNDAIWFCGGPVYGSESEILQVGLYRIAMFVQLVRWVAGPAWRPRQIRLQAPLLENQIDADRLWGASLTFHCSEPAIEVPRALLGRALQVTSAASTAVPVNSQQLTLDLRTSVKELLRTQLRGHKGNINDVARSVDMSVRTLQRRLSEHGLVFSELVEQTRLELARSLLTQTELPVQDIAAEVGYTESTHFSRAFKRLTGNSPREFRRYNAG